MLLVGDFLFNGGETSLRNTLRISGPSTPLFQRCDSRYGLDMDLAAIISIAGTTRWRHFFGVVADSRHGFGLLNGSRGLFSQVRWGGLALSSACHVDHRRLME